MKLLQRKLSEKNIFYCNHLKKKILLQTVEHISPFAFLVLFETVITPL